MIFKPIDIGPIIGALIGFAGTVYSIKKKRKTQNKTIFTILFLSILLIIFAMAFGGYLLWGKSKSIIVIDSDLKDSMGMSINKKTAPFLVNVKGTISNAENLFCYLVVDDGNAEWIEPGLGQGLDGEFSGNCYLGIREDMHSLNKRYVIFAVVTDKEHKDYDHLDRKTIRAISHRIDLYRTQ